MQNSGAKKVKENCLYHLRGSSCQSWIVWFNVYQYNDRLTQLFTEYKYIWLCLQCFDPYLGHRQADKMKCSTCLGFSCQTGSCVVHSIVHSL
jgi:hypothetical protein